MSVTDAEVQLHYKGLVTDELWCRLTNRIVADEDMELSLAERIMDQALGFLQFCAVKTDVGLYPPSKLVDIGWHTLILYTKDYASFCEKIAGRFIHHEPSDVPGVDYGVGAINVTSTVKAMKRQGFMVDEMLWATSGDCGDSGGSCCASSCRCN
jgi:hypothetical protein